MPSIELEYVRAGARSEKDQYWRDRVNEMHELRIAKEMSSAGIFEGDRAAFDSRPRDNPTTYSFR